MNVKLTKSVISREEAVKAAPDYVAFVEGDFDKFDKVSKAFGRLRKGQSVITFTHGQFVIAKVSSISHDDIRAVDGPVVRVTNGEYSWRVDGNGYAYPRAA
jgi:hypothetical protein